MAYSCAQLKELAVKTARYLAAGLSELKLAEGMRDAYVESCREAPPQFGVTPRTLACEDFRRHNFEILSFATFLVFGLLKARITKRRAFMRNKPDEAGISYFQEQLLHEIHDCALQLKCHEVREIILVKLDPKLEFGCGEPVAVADRVFDYLEANVSNRGSELRPFGKHIALALDPPRYPVLELIGMATLENPSRSGADHSEDHFRKVAGGGADAFALRAMTRR